MKYPSVFVLLTYMQHTGGSDILTTSSLNSPTPRVARIPPETGKHYNLISYKSKTLTPKNNSRSKPADEVVLAVVACGDRAEEALTMLKSCLMFSPKSPKRFIVVTDEQLIAGFRQKLLSMQQNVGRSFQFELMQSRFPNHHGIQWKRMFRPCATQRLFFPSMLPHIDSLVYMDSDTIFLSPVEELWQNFGYFRSKHIASITPYHENPHESSYVMNPRHPYHGRTGIQSGVMLMNLTRMRSFRYKDKSWEDYIAEVYKRWRTVINWADESILNIVFHFHSDKLLLLDCSFNYILERCSRGSSCYSGEVHGARVLHGGKIMAGDRELAKRVSILFRNYSLASEPPQNLPERLATLLAEPAYSNCNKMVNLFKRPRDFFRKPNEQRIV